MTYRKDENGNNVPIPLDERFKAGNNDIRYSSGDGELSQAQIMQILEQGGISQYRPFGDVVDDYVATKDDPKKRRELFGKRAMVIVGKTPELYEELGFMPLPMTLKQLYMKYATGEEKYNGNPKYKDAHGYSLEGFKNLPEKIAHPIAIIQDGSPDTVKVYIELDTDEGETAMVPLMINQNATVNDINIDVNHLKSVHGSMKDEIDLIKAAIENDRNDDVHLFYLDEDKYKKIMTPIAGDDGSHKSATNLPNGIIHRITDDGSRVKPFIKSIEKTQQYRNWKKNSNTENGNLVFASGDHDLTDHEKQQALIAAGVITQEDADIINSEMSSMGNETARPLEGQNPTMSTGQGTAQRAFGADNGMLQSSDEIDRFAKAVVSAQNSYFPDTNNEQVQRAVNWIRSLKATPNSDGFAEALQEVTRDNFDYRSADGQARMVAVMGMAVAKNDVMAQVALADAFNRQGTDLGRALQSRKLFKLMTPEGRIGTLQKMLQNTQDELDAKGIDVELKFSDWIYQAASVATEEGDMQKVMQAAAQELAEQLPANWKDRIRSLRMLSMLGNPRTHIRNVVGNAFFVPVVSLKNKLGAIAELGVKQGERTKTLSPFLNKAVKEFARQDAEAMKNELTGEAKYNEENAVQREQKAFKGLLQSVIDFNSNRLEKEDWRFLRGHYKRALGGWIQANGYTVEQLQKNPALLEKGRAYAIQEAQKATYRDFNQLAATLNDVSRKGGIAGFLVDAVLPFKKTPANILRRGIEYSPVGIMKSLTADLYHLKQYNDFQDGKLKSLPDKAISPTQFIDKLCSGLSGTAIMAVGALLSSAGIVSCGLDDDEDKLEKEKGNQEYAFKFSILGHDYTFTMDWAAPMSMPFFVGAAIQEQLAQQDDFDVERLVNAFGNITEPVFNLSMLDGVNTLLKTAQSNGQDTNTTLTQIGAKIASNYATSYVPSLLGAIARTVDDKRRKAFVESGKGTGVLGTFRYAIEQTENKIPGLSQTNIPYRDVWGNAETSGLVERILENFILPGYISEYKNEPILNEMDRLYTLTGDAGMIPSDPAKSVTYKKQKYVLNAEQWDEYKTVRGQTAYEMLNNLIQTDDYKTADANVQTQMIKDAWSYADSVGKSAIIPDYELTSKGSNPAQSIAKDAKINGYKDEMIKALNAGDWEAYDTMVEALHQSEVEDSDIKTKIGNTYRDQYKEAYKKDDWQRMSEIEDILDNTGFSFDIGAWEKQVDQSR